MQKTSITILKHAENLASLGTLAEKIAGIVQPGDTITLDGPLGSGKTTFTQVLCQALSVSESVTSPSFGLINEYTSGKYPIAHLDLYRLGPEKAHEIWDELNLFLDDYRHVILIEWSCYGERLPIDLAQEARLRLQFDYAADNPNARQISITGDKATLQALE